ncbi:hypothetical protein CDD81_4733 [Ophiocordyceps australis]|uniref:Sec39 domain-containing protein n=1 Tax=Ophiocordyceps australis TaxID=1399860 RepID=A0A2C5XVK5_9HYPO|nr:hypothetical protein CDD81_4733 [Ophiocordyceps australis]
MDALSDLQAAERARRLHLAPLDSPHAPANDPLSVFLYLRSCNIDTETGMLAHLPQLLMPFLHHSESLRVWILATVLPYVRRNADYYPEAAPAYGLLAFQRLPGPEAVSHLVSKTSSSSLGRDLDGLVLPWLGDDSRWLLTKEHVPVCPGWHKALDWLASHRLLTQSVSRWHGLDCLDQDTQLEPSKRHYLLQSFARAVIASVYTDPDSSVHHLTASYQTIVKLRSLLHHASDEPPLSETLSSLPCVPLVDKSASNEIKIMAATDLLASPCLALYPTPAATDLLKALTLSALVATRIGVSCSPKQAGHLALLQDEREQKTHMSKLFHALSSHASSHKDDYWLAARRHVLWLRDWGRQRHPHDKAVVKGPIATVARQHIESEYLRVLLWTCHYSLAAHLYQDGNVYSLPLSAIRDTVYQSALSAFDHASKPDYTSGGLKHCHDIIRALPIAANDSIPEFRRIEALLRATKTLGSYRLLLKEGELFSPVLLRVHSDPISLIDKVLEQNPQAYTRLQEFLETGLNMVRAGLPCRGRWELATHDAVLGAQDKERHMQAAEIRITAMCVEAALKENDFETAYSYVVNRLGAQTSLRDKPHEAFRDDWSWKAALQAGQYVRTAKSQKPTHLGTASGNPEIRHLEQRIDCLATALRAAPTCQLPGILKTFRRCEEQLDSAISDEATNEALWDAAANLTQLPGAFETHSPDVPTTMQPRNMSAATVAREADAAPMSLFDLSRATARVAQRNLTAISTLHEIATAEPLTAPQTSAPSRTRRRDQLKEAATGTLVSGVGWLIGANVGQDQSP